MDKNEFKYAAESWASLVITATVCKTFQTGTVQELFDLIGVEVTRQKDWERLVKEVAEILQGISWTEK